MVIDTEEEGEGEKEKFQLFPQDKEERGGREGTAWTERKRMMLRKMLMVRYVFKVCGFILTVGILYRITNNDRRKFRHRG